MQKKQNTFVNMGIGTIIYVLISALITPIITRIFSPEEYGRWSVFVLYGTLATNFMLLGLDQAFIRYYYTENSLAYRSKLLKICVRSPLLISLALFAVAFIIAMLFFDQAVTIILLFGIYLLSLEISRFCSNALRLDYKVKLYSLMQCLDKIFFLILALSLAWTVKFSDIMICSTVVSSLILMAIYLMICRKLWFKNTSAETYNFNIKEIYAYSLPLAISLIITSLFQATDKTLLSFMLGDAEVGIYAGAMSIVNIFAVVQTVFTTLWMPMAIEHYEKGGTPDFYVKANKIISAIMVTFGLTIILLKDVLIYFLGKEYHAAANVIPFLIYLPIMYTISETTVLGIIFKKKTTYQIWIGLVSFVTNVILDIFLIPRFGAFGASIATAISYVMFFVMRTFLSQRLYKIHFEFKSLVASLLCLTLFTVVDVFIGSFIVKLIVYAIIVVFISFCNRKIIIEVLKSLRRKKDENIDTCV